MLYYFIICLASNLMHKNDKKRLEIAKSILFHIHKHCTTSFTGQYPIFTSLQPIFTVIWLPVKVANSKREKWLQNDIKGVDLSHRVFKGPPCFNGVLYPILQVNTPFYKQTTHFHSFWSLLCIKSSKFEAGKTAAK